MENNKTIGLIIGKMEPFHFGHIALIEFATTKVDIVYVLLCTNDEFEEIPGSIRLKWLQEYYKDRQDVVIHHTDVKLPYTSVSSRYVSKVWSDHIKELFNDKIDYIISSEKYGDYVAEFLNIEHISYDHQRILVPISGTVCRSNPFYNWDFLPDVTRPYFVKKICVCGTESTGKTTLTERLSKTFNTNFVKEWAREIVPNSETCTKQMLLDIGYYRSKDINEKILLSNKVLFIDSGLSTTKMYGKFLFGEIPIYEKWIEDANNFDLYLFLENDVPFVQDGTRLSKEKRDELRNYQYNDLKENNANMKIIDGTDWEERYLKSINIIKEKYNI